MSEFYNPYHFVPVEPFEPNERKGDITRDDLKTSTHITHDRYAKESKSEDVIYSGRMVCKMTTEDPIFIGNERPEVVDGKAAEVSHFELDNKPAIPASSLRGLISGITEAASNSSLRVLEDRPLSLRKDMRDSLGCIGMLVDDEEGGLRLRPLTIKPLPLIPNSINGEGKARIPQVYKEMFNEASGNKSLLKVYVNGYEEGKRERNDFLGMYDPYSYSSTYKEFWYMKLDEKCFIKGDTLTSNNPYIKSIENRRTGETKHFLGGQQGTCIPISQIEFKKKSDVEQKKYTRGILRVLGIEGREENIPKGKKHEIFLPYPEGIEKTPTFDVKDALKTFYNLADERTKADKNTPFNLKGSLRNAEGIEENEDIIRFKDGEIVFFEVDKRNNKVVGEIAISSIWRKSAGGGSHEYFRKISSEILPFNKNRKQISIAEQMFGFVEYCERNDKEPGLAFTSRLRFSFGYMHPFCTPQYGKEVLLKILDSPKPPCPSLYFKSQSEGYISKKNLSIAGRRDIRRGRDEGKFIGKDHIPQGRKFYLHKHKDQKTPWKTGTTHEDDNLAQKSLIKPLKPRSEFYFHIDFNNLSKDELGLLCYAVRPAEEFRHKIGMGKSIGMGKVCIDPIGLFYIDREKRYQKDNLFSSQRYHSCWTKEEPLDNWPASYKHEMACKTRGGESFESLRDIFAVRINPNIKYALELLGDPSKIHRHVKTPSLINQDPEKETFKWFVENEKEQGERRDSTPSSTQWLRPLKDSDTEGLPILNELEGTEKNLS